MDGKQGRAERDRLEIHTKVVSLLRLDNGVESWGDGRLSLLQYRASKASKAAFMVDCAYRQASISIIVK
jgi:hypothetical protein